MRALIMIGETGQLTFYDEVGQRLERMGFEISLCCDRDDPGVADAVEKVAVKNTFNFFRLQENFSSEQLTMRLPRSSVSKIIEKLIVWSEKLTGIKPDKIQFIFKKLKSYSTRLSSYFFQSSEAKVANKIFQIQVSYHRAQNHIRQLNSEKLFADNDIDILILGEDGLASNLWAINVAKRIGVKVVVIPYGMAYSNFLLQKGLMQKQGENGLITVDELGGDLVEKEYPEWVKDTEFGKVLYWPPSVIIALNEEGIKLRDPWCFQGGDADIILSEGPEMFDRYVMEGVPQKKLKITGSIYSDVLFDHINADKNLLDAFNENSVISEGELKILVCVPPTEDDYWSQRVKFKTLMEFFSSVDQKLKKYTTVQVTYSFHPRLSNQTREEFIDLGICPSELPVFNLIAKNDLVIMNNSSLCRWAIQAKKPVLNFDFYGFGSNYFPDTLGYYYTKNFKSFSTQLDKIISGAIKYETLSIGCNQKAQRMGIFDGRCAERMADAIRNISSEKEKQI
jgi:hypothetical protein